MATATPGQSYSDRDDLTQQTYALSDVDMQCKTPSLISRLLPEILQIVFIHCACDHYTSSALTEPGAAPSWVNVSYVCRYWRDVALACPVLWSYLFISSPRWTEVLLARSKQAPLKVQVNQLYTQIERVSCFVQQVRNHVERIQELDLEIYDGNFTEGYYRTLCVCAPRLRHLRIVIGMGPDTERLPELLGGETPALRTLELSKCIVPRHAFKLSGLTTLGLYNVHIPDQKGIAEFLATLRSMQHLENLYLIDVLPSNTFRSSATSHALEVELPHLSRLLIIAPLSTVAAFLTSVLNIPPKTKLRLDCHSEDEFSIRACAQLFSVLGNRQAQSTPTWRSLVIEHAEPPGQTEFTFSTLEHDVDALHPWLLQWASPALFKIRLQLRGWTPHVLGTLLSSMPLPNLHVLRVISPPCAPEFWRAVLEKLPGVRAIRLSLGDLPDLASVLVQHPGRGGHADGHADSGRMLAPALEALDLDPVRPSMHPAGLLPPADAQIGDLVSLCEAIATRRGGADRLVVNRWCEQVDASSGTCQSDLVGEWRRGLRM